MPNLAPNFVNVTVNLPAVGVVPQSFNTGLIIGSSNVISTGTRVAQYSSLADVLAAGFATNSAEYLAASLYFSSPSQPNQLCVGRKGSGETSLAALTACRVANSLWYAAYDTTAADSDQAAIAAYVEALTAPFTQYFCQSSTSAVKAGTGGNIFETLKNSSYKRTHGLFSSNANAVASIMGYAMGQTSNLANSRYTLKFKTMPGVTPESLTETQVTNIENNNGNIYIARSSNMYEQGKNFSGQFFDEVIGLDMLSNAIQVAISNFLLSVPSAPLTEGGVAQLRNVVSQACEQSVTRGFLAAGEWGGSPILSLATGDTLPSGYLVLSDAVNGLSQSDRNNRISPNLYACVKLANSIHSVVLKINVNR